MKTSIQRLHQGTKDTGKKSGPINKKLSELINTLWQQNKSLDKLKDERVT